MKRYRSVYPADWIAISKRIRLERAKGRCEWCGAVNYQAHPVTGSRVVLTVAHLGAPLADGSPGDKHDKADVREENLAALCQRCHLNFDREDHLARTRVLRAYHLRRGKHGQRYEQLPLPL